MPRKVAEVLRPAQRIAAKAREVEGRTGTDLDVEDVEQEAAQDEGRQRIPDGGQGRDDLVRPAVLLDRGKHAERDRDDRGHEKGRSHELERRRDLLGDLLRDRPAVDERIAPRVGAERELPERGEPAEELLERRLVQAVQPDEVGDHLGRDAAGPEAVRGIARRGLDDDEGDDADPDEDRDRLEQSTQDVDRHRAELRSVSVRPVPGSLGPWPGKVA